VEQDWFRNSAEIDKTPLPARHSIHREDFPLNNPVDWIVHIISVDLDGTITVRLGALQDCRDVRVPLEKILLVLDEETVASNGPPVEALDVLDDEALDFYGLDGRTIIQTIEYEGGQRLDGDSDDEMWMTEEEDNEGEDDGEDDNTADDDDTTDDLFTVPEVAEIKVAEQPDHDETEDARVPAVQRPTPHDDQPAILGSVQPASHPPSFSILETSPPSDHHFLPKSSSQATAQRLRRIRKEYQILETSLPEGIFARTWESRIDLLRVLIIGPQGTPY
jgi:ubiquitin-conjugating enzyme E2 O